MAGTRLSKVAKEFNISLERVVEFLAEKGHKVEQNPNAKISDEMISLLSKKFHSDKDLRVASQEVSQEQRREKEAIRQEREKEKHEKEKLEKEKQEKERLLEEEKRKKEEQEIIKAKAEKTISIKAVGQIDLDKKQEEKPKEHTSTELPQETSLKTEEPKQAEIEKQSVPQKEKKEKKVKEFVKEKVVKSAIDQAVEKAQKVAVKKEEPKAKEKEVAIITEPEKVTTQYTKLSGPKVTGVKIDLSQFDKSKKKKTKDSKDNNKDKNTGNSAEKENKKRKRIKKEKEQPITAKSNNNKPANKDDKKFANKKKPVAKPFLKVEPTEEEIQKQVRETLERLQGKSNKSKSAKYRREKRDNIRQKVQQDIAQQEQESKILKVTEFVTVNELAVMMDIPATKIIGACMSLGIMATMNQRLDAETLTIVADEFGYQIEFSTADIQEAIPIQEDSPEDLVPRAPIVTVMGHVDHGKTSLLDYIRNENVIAGESGGITQHIGAYSVKLENGQHITFLDTPGHEAFTAMRARGTKVTDIAIIVIAADDDIMPQTKEAISHAQAANVPIIFAINKIDKPEANPDKIKERLAGMNLLVEDWGGKIQSHDISAKKGIGVSELLEKVLLEAELLELKANPDKLALGTIVEARLDRGRGYVSTVLVEEGTLKIGDYVLAGTQFGKVRAMHDERGKSVKAAGPSMPVSVLGLDGAPQAGDKFYVFEDEKEAKQIATKRTQLLREQSVRTQRHITLDEIGRRIALGDFKQLNIILKGDVDGSVEALTDSFQKLSTEEIQVSIIHKGVGAITESDVLLASASDAIIVGFNVRPMANARALADKEEIDIRTYSIIYDAIGDLKSAMEGMLSPEMKEEVTGNVEIRELFKISKVGTIAGCMVTSGKIFRNSKIRIIREGVVIYTGELASLKRFKDDVKEVSKGYDCGLQIKNYNDIKEYDLIEAYQEVAVKKKL